MHPLRHPRNAALLGLIFLVIAVLFWVIPAVGGWHVDYAGITMLFANPMGLSLGATQPPDGSHPRRTANVVIKMRARMKLGTAIPITAAAESTVPLAFRRRVAASTPIGIATSTERIKLKVASQAVT